MTVMVVTMATHQLLDKQIPSVDHWRKRILSASASLGCDIYNGIT